MNQLRLKIFLSIFISFFLSSFLIRLTDNPNKPNLNLSKLTPQIKTIKLATNSLFSRFSISSLILKSPLPTPTTLPQNTQQTKINFAKIPTSSPSHLTPTNTLTIRLTRIRTPIPYKKPTSIKPTNRPSPTKIPEPSPTPLAPPEYLRPGKDLEDIFKIAAEMSCIPVNLLKSIIKQESGALTYGNEQALFYNAYDWWHRAQTKQVICSGYGYFVETGLIAEDSLFAGERCKEAFSEKTANDIYSRALGASQMLEIQWNKHYKDKVKQKLQVDKVDRRVLIDSLIGLGISLKEGTRYSGSCDNWDFKYIIKAGCVNAGGCDYYNYCYTICNNYNKFSGENNNCDYVKDLFKPGTCNFK